MFTTYLMWKQWQYTLSQQYYRYFFPFGSDRMLFLIMVLSKWIREDFSYISTKLHLGSFSVFPVLLYLGEISCRLYQQREYVGSLDGLKAWTLQSIQFMISNFDIFFEYKWIFRKVNYFSYLERGIRISLSRLWYDILNSLPFIFLLVCSLGNCIIHWKTFLCKLWYFSCSSSDERTIISFQYQVFSCTLWVLL